MNEMLRRIVEFFARFDARDWVTVVASISALTLSILSFLQRSGEGRIALRKQLTDLLEKITELNTDAATFRYNRSKTDEYPPNYIGLLNDQRRFLVRQAAFVASKIRALVSPYEYLLIGGGFDAVDDTYQAERFYLIAAKAKDQLDRVIAVRSYARYLFNQGRIDEARERYAEVLHEARGETDRLKDFRANTYERWANQEREWSNETEARTLLERSAAEFGLLSNPARRAHEVARVTALLSPPTEVPRNGGHDVP